MEKDNTQNPEKSISFEVMEYFLDEFPEDLLFEKRNPQDKQEELAFEAFKRLMDITFVIERLNKYEIYFAEFYTTSENISEAEAVEYHLHSYLQDAYSLREKISRLIGLLKNGIPTLNIGNSDEVKGALNHLKIQVDRGLTQMLDLRGKHVHDMSVRDPALARATLLRLVQVARGTNDEKIEKEYQELVNTARTRYISQAQNNKKELNRMKEFFLSRIAFIFAAMYGHDSSRFTEVMNQTGEE